MGQNFEARQMRIISSNFFWDIINDARLSNPAKNRSHKSARHLQKTRAREMAVDTRCLPGAWLPAVVLLFCPPAERWQCDAATSCHVRIPSSWLVSVHSMTSNVYPQQAIHMLMLAIASLTALDQEEAYKPKNIVVCVQ